MEEIYGVLMFVSSGQGWTLIPRNATRLIPPGCVAIPLSDFSIPMPHGVVYRAAAARPVVDTVLGIIRRMMAAEHHGQTLEPDASAGTAAWERSESAAASVIELRHLRYFNAVVEAQSFGRAAERLALTQPALSRQIRNLEQAVGIPLLDRAARGATATAGGLSLYSDALRILDEAGAMSAEAQRAQRGTIARCILGAVPSNNALMLLRGLFQRAALEFPKLELTVHDFMTPDQPGALRSARIDLGLAHASPLSPSESRGVRRERLLNDTVSCALVPAESSFAKRKSIELEELSDVPLIFAGRSFQPGLHDEIFAAFAGLAFQPRVDQTYEGMKTVWALVADGHGWGIGFQSQYDDPPTGTVAIPIVGLSVPWGIDVLLREDESRSAILRVVDVLHEIARVHAS
jgi:LysR family transcriptional regulator, benzoate and cis,cis-muconate-responsive activator of ben and cat genes